MTYIMRGQICIFALGSDQKYVLCTNIPSQHFISTFLHCLLLNKPTQPAHFYKSSISRELCSDNKKIAKIGQNFWQKRQHLAFSLHRLDQGTLLPVVVVVTNISYWWPWFDHLMAASLQIDHMTCDILTACSFCFLTALFDKIQERQWLELGAGKSYPVWHGSSSPNQFWF